LHGLILSRSPDNENARRAARLTQLPAAVAAAIQAPLRLAQHVTQYHGVIAARIVRGVEQRHALLRSAVLGASSTSQSSRAARRCSTGRESSAVESVPAKVQTWADRGVSRQ
jgi:hypothetical protein